MVMNNSQNLERHWCRAYLDKGKLSIALKCPGSTAIQLTDVSHVDETLFRAMIWLYLL